MKTKKKKRPLKKKLLIGAGTGLIFLICLFAFLHTGFVKSRVLRYASKYMEETQNIRLSAGFLSYNLLQLRFIIKDVSLRTIDKTEPEQTPFFEAQKVKIDIPLKLVLRNKLSFNEITVTHPRFCFVIHQDSSSNLPFGRSFSKNESSGHSFPEIRVKKLLLENAYVDFRDWKKDMSFQLSQLGVGISWIDDSQHEMSLNIEEEGTFQYKRNIFPVNEIMLKGRLDTKGAFLQNFRVNALESNISGSGRIEDFSNPFVHFDLWGTVDTENIKKFFRIEEDISGKIVFKSRIHGSLDSINTEAKLNSRAFQYGPVKASDFKAEVVWREEKLIIPLLNITIPDGKFYASAELNPLDWGKGSHLDLKWESLDPNLWLDFFSIPFGINTRASGNLKATWDQLSFEALKAKASLDFRKAKGSALKKNFLPLQARIKADLDSEQLSLNAEKINIPGALLSGKIQLDSQEISGNYHLNILNLNDLMPYLSLFSAWNLPQDISQWKMAGAAAASGSIGGKLSSPRIKAKIESSQFSVKNFKDLKLSGKFEYENKTIRFESVEIQAGFPDERKLALAPLKDLKAEPKIKAQGQINLEDKSYKINLVTDPLKIEEIVFEQKGEPLCGLMDVKLEGEGSLDSPNFQIEVNISDLKKGAEEIGIMNLNIESTGGEVRYNAILYPSLSGCHGSFRINGPFPFVQDLSFHTDVDLSLINSLFDGVKVKGKLKSNCFIPGQFDFTKIQAFLYLTEGELIFIQPDLLLDQVKANIMISERTVKISSVSFDCENGRYTLNGDIPFETFMGHEKDLIGVPEGRMFTLDASWENFETSVLSSLFSSEIFSRFKCQSDGKLHVTSRGFQWDRISGKADINKLDFNTQDVSLQLRRSASLEFKKGTLFLKSAEFMGKDSHLKLEGALGLFPEQASDIGFEGEVDLSVLQPFLESDSLSGKVLFETKLTQSLLKPHLSGNLELRNAGWRTDQPPLHLSGVEGRIRFDQTKVYIQKISGDLNGGDVKVSGELDLGIKEHPLAGLEITAERVLFDFPKGMQSEISLDMFFSYSKDEALLSGDLNIMYAKYKEPFRIQSALLQYLRKEASLDSFMEPNEFLSQLKLNVSISAQESIFVENNISKSLLSANLTLTGTLFKPILSGRAQFEEGGEIYFGGNTFVIETGSADFINPIRIEPDLNIRALTRVGEYDIRLLLTGTPDKFSAGLVSEPPLSEPDIISLLVTGKTLENASSQILDVAGNKATSYINSSLTGQLERATRKTIGLESVKIDASLIAAEENPSARITVGQHVSRNIELVYSHDLKEARNRMWIVNYNPVRNVNIQGIKRDENEYTVGLQHDLRFGLPEVKRPGKELVTGKKVLRLVRIEESGNIVPLDKNILSQMKLKKGEKFNFITLQKDLESIKKYYIKKDHPNAVVRVDKEEDKSGVSLRLFIDPGPKIFIHYQNAKIAPKLKKNIRDILIRGAFKGWALDEAQKQLLMHFTKKKYFKAKIRVQEINRKQKTKEIIFQIHPGIKYSDYSVNIEGNRFISNKKLLGYLKKSGQLTALIVSPEKVIKNLENYYSQIGFLQATFTAHEPRFEPENQTSEVSLSVDEGVRFRIGELKVTGNRFFSQEQIIQAGDLEKPQFYSQNKISEGRLKIREKYIENGFINAQVRSEVEVQEEKGLVDCVFIILENRQGIIKEIEITGNKKAKTDIIRRELSVKEGETLDFQKIGESRKKLYDLGIFERVDIEAVPSDGFTSSQDEPKTETPQIQNYQIRTRVYELQPYRLRYGIQFDTEALFGLRGELVNRNFLGRAQLVGTSFKVNQDEQDTKAFIRTPYFFGQKINTEAFAFFNRTLKPSFTVDRSGVTFMQQLKLNKYYVLSYDYTYEKNRTFDLKLSGPLDFDPTAHISSISIAITRDTRDSFSNTKQGTFVSQNIKYAPKFLGSDTNLIRYFGQAYIYKPVTDFLVYSSGLRLGFARGIGDELIPSERFFAGGSTTVRGFGKDALGPLDPLTGDPVGGEAVFILNQELRFPVYKILGGAVFIDMGNVYSSLSDFDPFDLRKTAGLGLRIHTSFLVFRLDWGIKLDPKPGETKSKFFLSIGQAF
ncbi:MAG: BamA/TamA family outer membrane protein [Candidatus Aminicenantes bacterium]|nr:BamA/TamA family outer membrane protein [Candidatus Aminicenantes bacterium]